VVEFYFGQLVEHVRKQSQLHPRLEEMVGDDRPPEGDQPIDDRRAAPPEGPVSFCPEGCYWACEHR
jgi:hypothetical protein